MPLPEDFTDLQLAGYRPLGRGTCNRCSGGIYWFLTPKNCRMPFSLKVDWKVNESGGIYIQPSLNKMEPHMAACPYLERERRKKK